MSKKTIFIIVTVIGVAALLSGLGVLIWWLVALQDPFTIVVLEGDGIGDVAHHAGLTRIRSAGDMFWWFYPTLTAAGATRPLLLWLDGVTGLPPSLLANFGMFGPYDFNLNRRNDSWVDQYNLLFVDSPIGTGFSTATSDSNIPSDLEANTEHLLYTLEAFYSLHEEYQNSPLYIFGQGHGAQLALSLTIELNELSADALFTHNLQGVILANGIISPALALTQLGFYLEEMGYVDRTGRTAIEGFSETTNSLVNNENLEEAFDQFLTLGNFVNEEAGTVAVNLDNIVVKMIREPEATRDYFGLRKHIRTVHRTDLDFNYFMENTVAPAIGHLVNYDSRRDAAIEAVRGTFMIPAVDKVEYILNNTAYTVTIYNGNVDAVSTTPGQLEWVNNLQWPGQAAFLNSPRRTLVVNSLVEGYFRETDRLKFYWMNAAGQSVPLDSPVAMRRVLERITGSTSA